MIHLSLADITETEERHVIEALRSGWVAPLGPEVELFEQEMAARVGVAGGLALASGTAALHLALLGVGVDDDCVVVVPTMTFAASAFAVAYTGAKPVFVDVEEHDGNLDVDVLLGAVDELVAEGVRVGAVMTVDLYGRTADYARLAPALAERRIPLVEDAAEALGAVDENGRAAGSFGMAAALSFNGNKIMTTSGGGMILSDDLALLERARHLSTQARQPVPWYEHQEVGYNYRLSNILAALGRGQLSRLDEMIARRKQIHMRYRAALGGLDGVRFLGDEADGGNCWLTSAVFDPARLGRSGPELVTALNARQIEARHLWKPMHLQPVFASSRRVVTGAAERLFGHGINLPSGSVLTDEEVDLVITTIGDELAAA
ncbi:DegT/DnrJ/EryC1/StrS family aminotransferase [Ornithinimicrobium avium]|uniref:Aminotransferase class I/II-fold pyridoxal phosphate-dependent enzyme n=1 Tax=Ornithinimicrobium avium TaxID=2283195 RepID=A0A345NPA6_9MICO|nr:aminotransferase class I/II-fold pyridoxal phosphate-dependent enzyme [Ornithinimicrobium avium]AXH96864.1 aminotransferase class I/II-fold pyridoxal phosphate-dependent enzyme [Ornithinimicrobium avium]